MIDGRASPRYPITLHHSASHSFHIVGVTHWLGSDAAVNILIRVLRKLPMLFVSILLVIVNVDVLAQRSSAQSLLQHMGSHGGRGNLHATMTLKRRP
jgi:hypothetical protein